VVHGLHDNEGENDDANRERVKNVTPMEFEQRQIAKFCPLKGLKLGDITVELSTVYGENA
jgi:hypothetical protein